MDPRAGNSGHDSLGRVQPRIHPSRQCLVYEFVAHLSSAAYKPSSHLGGGDERLLIDFLSGQG